MERRISKHPLGKQYIQILEAVRTLTDVNGTVKFHDPDGSLNVTNDWVFRDLEVEYTTRKTKPKYFIAVYSITCPLEYCIEAYRRDYNGNDVYFDGLSDPILNKIMGMMVKEFKLDLDAK